jgi:hypothetical protein
VEQQTLVNERENQTYSEDDGEISGNNGDETSQQQRNCFELKIADPSLFFRNALDRKRIESFNSFSI